MEKEAEEQLVPSHFDSLRDPVDRVLLGQTGQTKLTSKLGLPRNLCRATFAILAAPTAKGQL